MAPGKGPSARRRGQRPAALGLREGEWPVSPLTACAVETLSRSEGDQLSGITGSHSTRSHSDGSQRDQNTAPLSDGLEAVTRRLHV